MTENRFFFILVCIISSVKSVQLNAINAVYEKERKVFIVLGRKSITFFHQFQFDVSFSTSRYRLFSSSLFSCSSSSFSSLKLARFFALYYSKNVPSCGSTKFALKRALHHITSYRQQCVINEQKEKPNRFITLIIITDRVISDESNFLLRV